MKVIVDKHNQTEDGATAFKHQESPRQILHLRENTIGVTLCGSLNAVMATDLSICIGRFALGSSSSCISILMNWDVFHGYAAMSNLPRNGLDHTLEEMRCGAS